MFSKPLAFVLLALACLTAAAGGAYMATRRNLTEATAVRPGSTSAALTTPSGAQPATSQPVAETEAPVSSAPKPAAVPDAPAAEPAPPPEPAPTTTSTPPTTAHASAPAAAKPASKSGHPAQATSSRPVQRTVPTTETGAPAQGQAAPPQPATSAAASAAKPTEPVKPVEEPQPEPRAPQFEDLILPAASVIGLQVESNLSSEQARVEDRVDARVSRDVMASGRVAIPAGSRVVGSVVTVDRGGKVKEPARLGIRFHTLVLADGTQVQLHTDTVYRVGQDPTAGSAKKIGGAAIGGAILGAILGGGKGAAIGTAAGAGGGTAAVMAGDRNPATLHQGEYVNVKLATPATITVERREQ